MKTLILMMSILSPSGLGTEGKVLMWSQYTSISMDLVSTERALSRGGVESNWLMAPLLNDGHVSGWDRAAMLSLAGLETAMLKYTWSASRSQRGWRKWILRAVAWTPIALRVKAIRGNLKF